jgi:hypothetical protein
MTPKNTICLWFDKDAEDAARFYAATFPNSKVTAVRRAPGDFPSGKENDVLTVEFTVFGIPCVGLNGGPSVTAAKRASVGGAKTAGAFPGRSPRAPSLTRWRPVALKQNVPSMR